MQNTSPHPPLKLHALSHRFGDKEVLTNISLTLPASGISALLGSNGAGKTTLLNCALGLLEQSDGDIHILGAPAGSAAAKQQVGVMLQDTDLPDLLTAREHIDLFSAYYEKPIPTDELLRSCDLTDFADKKYKQLSGGQKRRVQFALAILGQPKVLFLDEPTAGLDSEARRVLWNTIRSLRATGTAVLLTTHYLEEADALADHIVIIDNGEIVVQGPTSTIRELVSGAVIRCQTRLDVDDVLAIESVRSAQRSGRYLEIICSNSTATLKNMLTMDADLQDLSIVKPSLENAFHQLTDKAGAS